MVAVKMGEDENVTRGVGMSNYPEIIYLGHFCKDRSSRLLFIK